MTPYISIIMPVYNNEKYLPKAIKSIVDQTFNDWELIIVDDGSTDRTPEIADEWARLDKRIKVIHQENQWIYNSCNNGIAVANGKYVLVVNSDDTINIDALKKIHKISVNDDVDIVFFNLSINECDEEQNVINKDLYNLANLLKEDFILTDISKLRIEWPIFVKQRLTNHQCVYKTEIAKKHRYRTDIYAADYYYNIQIAKEIKSVAGTSYVAYNHFWYKDTKMNASVGKYYIYEHVMNTQFYLEYKNLFESWNLDQNKYQSIISEVRLRHFSRELKGLNSFQCNLTIDEKLQNIFEEFIDDIVYGCAFVDNRLDELDRRVLFGCRTLFEKDIPKEDSKYYFVYELSESLLRYEKCEQKEHDLDKIKNAVYNKNNPRNIGKTFLEKIELGEGETNV